MTIPLILKTPRWQERSTTCACIRRAVAVTNFLGSKKERNFAKNEWGDKSILESKSRILLHSFCVRAFEQGKQSQGSRIGLGGFRIWRPHNFGIFWPPLSVPIIYTVCPQILVVSWPPFCADVIYGSPLRKESLALPPLHVFVALTFWQVGTSGIQDSLPLGEKYELQSTRTFNWDTTRGPISSRTWVGLTWI